MRDKNALSKVFGWNIRQSIRGYGMFSSASGHGNCWQCGVVEDGVNGLLVPVANSEELAEKILLLARIIDLEKLYGKKLQKP